MSAYTVTAKKIAWKECDAGWNGGVGGFVTDHIDATPRYFAISVDGAELEFHSLQKAKDWCQSQLDKWIASVAVVTPIATESGLHAKTLRDLLACCLAWEPNVCVMGNVRAQDAANAIKNALLNIVPPLKHSGECETDPHARDVCEGTYREKVDDVIQLSAALRAVLALAGESEEVRKIVDDAIAEHGL